MNTFYHFNNPYKQYFTRKCTWSKLYYILWMIKSNTFNVSLKFYAYKVHTDRGTVSNQFKWLHRLYFDKIKVFKKRKIMLSLWCLVQNFKGINWFCLCSPYLPLNYLFFNLHIGVLSLHQKNPFLKGFCLES